MLQIIGILSGLISISGYLPYIRDVIKKTTYPERASWLIWDVLTAIDFFSLMAKGAYASLWLPGLETVAMAIVLLLSIKFGTGGLSRKDVYSLIAAGIGLILWYVTKEPAVALYITIGIDCIGTILALQKAYEDPASETLSTWVLVAVAGVLSMISVGEFNIVLLSYPFYIFAANASIASAILLGRNRKTSRVSN